MCETTPTPEPGNPRSTFPDAWYDVASRLAAARAVASCIFDRIPCGDRARPVMDELGAIGDLAAAVVDLLDLCKRDNARVEEQILSTARKGA